MCCVLMYGKEKQEFLGKVMNNKEIVNKIGNIFEQTYYYSNVLSADCTIDSLIRIDDERYNCEGCVLLDTIHTIRIMCPMVMKRECKVLR